MRLVEVLLLIVLSVVVVCLLLRGSRASLWYRRALPGCVLLLVWGLLVEGHRWQMYPAYLTVAILGLVALKRHRPGVAWRVVIGAFAGLMTALAASLIALMPVPVLPAPTGPYAVGTFEFSAVDESRRERYDPIHPREIYVQAWYPAVPAPEGMRPRSLWAELYRGERDWVRFVFGYLRLVRTHAFVELPIAPHSRPFPVLLFNPGLSGTADSSSVLVEDLASHGYVIFGIAHPYEALKVNLADGRTVRLELDYPPDVPFTAEEGTDRSGLGATVLQTGRDRRLKERINTATYELIDELVAARPGDRMQLAAAKLPAYRELGLDVTADGILGLAMNRWFRALSVQSWVEDTAFLADQLDARTLPIPLAAFYDAIETGGYGVLGFSYGGATSGEFCKIDHRCRAGINFDGTQFGFNWSKPIQAPFLAIYHEAHAGGNDFAFAATRAAVGGRFSEIVLPGTEHGDLFDMAYLYPALRHAGILSGRDTTEVMREVSGAVQEFFSVHLTAPGASAGRGSRSIDEGVRPRDGSWMKASCIAGVVRQAGSCSVQ